MLWSGLNDDTLLDAYLTTCTNAQKAKLLQILCAHSDEVWFLQFSNNGKYLASASNDKSAIIWKVCFWLLIFFMVLSGLVLIYLEAAQSHPLFFSPCSAMSEI
jgi:WD40 repeat protein